MSRLLHQRVSLRPLARKLKELHAGHRAAAVATAG